MRGTPEGRIEVLNKITRPNSIVFSGVWFSKKASHSSGAWRIPWVMHRIQVGVVRLLVERKRWIASFIFLILLARSQAGHAVADHCLQAGLVRLLAPCTCFGRAEVIC